MGKYENYLQRLKGVNMPLNSDEMYSRINSKIKKRNNAAYLVGSSLAILLIVSALVFNYYPLNLDSADTISEYVAQQNLDANGDLIMSYVFMD